MAVVDLSLSARRDLPSAYRRFRLSAVKFLLRFTFRLSSLHHFSFSQHFLRSPRMEGTLSTVGDRKFAMGRDYHVLLSIFYSSPYPEREAMFSLITRVICRFPNFQFLHFRGLFEICGSSIEFSQDSCSDCRYRVPLYM